MLLARRVVLSTTGIKSQFESASEIFQHSFLPIYKSRPRIVCFTLAQMKLCENSWPPKFNSLVVEPKVGMVLPLVLVRVTLTGQASRGGQVCSDSGAAVD